MSNPFPLAGVLGYPVSHSLSPKLHSAWLADLGLAGAYIPLAVAPENLPVAISGLKALGFVGANVTIPHKETVMALVDSIDETARAIGAVNTLVISEAGIEGRNTDAEGFLAQLQRKAPRWQETLKAKSVLILGAGGAARAVVYALGQAGVLKLILTNRNRGRAEALVPLSAPAEVEVIDWSDRNQAIENAGLIINTTSLGMRGQPPLEIDLSKAPSDAIIYDLVYSPLNTNLLRTAARQSLVCVDGLGMLVLQARAGFRAWYGADPSTDESVFRRLAGWLPKG